MSNRNDVTRHNANVGENFIVKDKLNCMFINARSINSNFKLEELHALAIDNELDLIGIAETWLNDSILDSEISLSGFTVYRKDRFSVKHARGGGVLLYVRNSLLSVESNYLNTLQNESVWCEVHGGSNSSVLVGVVYKSPSAEPDEVNNMLSMLRSISGKRVLVMGDFNYPKINWNTFESDSSGEAFLDVILDNFWIQHVTSPTREQNILDLVITSEESMVENLSVDEHLSNSDHNIVNFVLVFETRIVNCTSGSIQL